jgi:hypothetical protein
MLPCKMRKRSARNCQIISFSKRGPPQSSLEERWKRGRSPVDIEANGGKITVTP